MYSGSINYSPLNQRDLLIDTSENVTQIGTWVRDSFVKDKFRIELFLRLTRKNLDALSDFPASSSFTPDFQKFSHSFGRLEQEYRTGITNRGDWARRMLTWGVTLKKILL